MDGLDLDMVRERLLERQSALDAKLTGMAAPPERGSAIGFGKRVGDGTIEAVRRLTDVGVGGRLEVSQARVARALEKLGEGSYGTCDRCGESISAARLQAAPESVLCISCARLPR